MPESHISGIRYGRDLRDELITGTVETLDGFLAPIAERFFFDTADIDEHVIGGKHLVDAYGWIVPLAESNDFERAYLAERDHEDDAFGEQFYRSVTWEDHDGVPLPVID